MTPLLTLLAGCLFLTAEDWDQAVDPDGDGDPSPAYGGGDCDPDDPRSHSRGTEVCDGVDNDCDQQIDEADATDALTWYRDGDGDGFGVDDETVVACAAPSGFTDDDADCADDDAGSNPDATELCDQVDNDCDEVIDEDDAQDAETWYRDADGDGIGGDEETTVACDLPEGFSSEDTDCDDTDATVFPNAPEVCDGVDNNCDPADDPNVMVPSDAWPDLATLAEGVSTGDHVCLGAGTWSTGELTLPARVTLEGAGVDATVLEATGAPDVVVFVAGSDVTVQGLGITGAAGRAFYVDRSVTGVLLSDLRVSDFQSTAGTVYLRESSETTMSRVDVVGVEVVDEGGGGGYGVQCQGCTATLDNVRLMGIDTQVTADCWGAVWAYEADLSLTNVIIAGNHCESLDGGAGGAGLVAYGAGQTRLENVSITGNSLDVAGTVASLGVYSYSATTQLTMVNVDVSNNWMDSDDWSGSGAFAGQGAWSFSHCNAHGNDGGRQWSAAIDPGTDDGNRSEAPGYVATSDPDPLLWDLSLAEDSALIDAGWAELLDPDGSTSDIGAYGGPAAAGYLD